MNWKAAGLFLLAIASLFGYLGLVATACYLIDHNAGSGWALATMFTAIIGPATIFIGIAAKDDA